nr:aminotransferase class III-fold pyridoxal phosphate-dependent enzyme [Propionibacteriaceae bacterium]
VQEYFDVTPDLAVFAKGVANGMPLAVLAGTADVMASMTDAMISITYGGEALSLAASKATLEIYCSEPVIETIWTRGRQLRIGLTAAAKVVNLPFSVVGYDPMTAMRFDGFTPEDDADAWGFVLQEMAARGVLMRRNGLNFISYSHTEADIATVIDRAGEVFADLASLLASGSIRERLRIREVDTGFRAFR